jgi:hypothetical protein
MSEVRPLLTGPDARESALGILGGCSSPASATQRLSAMYTSDLTHSQPELISTEPARRRQDSQRRLPLGIGARRRLHAGIERRILVPTSRLARLAVKLTPATLKARVN